MTRHTISFRAAQRAYDNMEPPEYYDPQIECECAENTEDGRVAPDCSDCDGTGYLNAQALRDRDEAAKEDAALARYESQWED